MPSTRPCVTVRFSDEQYRRVLAAAAKDLRQPANFVAMAVQALLQSEAPEEVGDPIEAATLSIDEANERYGQLICTGRDAVIAQEKIEVLCGKNGLMGWRVPPIRPEWRAARDAYLAVKWAKTPVVAEPSGSEEQP